MSCVDVASGHGQRVVSSSSCTTSKNVVRMRLVSAGSQLTLSRKCRRSDDGSSVPNARANHHTSCRRPSGARSFFSTSRNTARPSARCMPRRWRWRRNDFTLSSGTVDSRNACTWSGSAPSWPSSPATWASVDPSDAAARLTALVGSSVPPAVGASVWTRLDTPRNSCGRGIDGDPTRRTSGAKRSSRLQRSTMTLAASDVEQPRISLMPSDATHRAVTRFAWRYSSTTAGAGVPSREMMFSLYDVRVCLSSTPNTLRIANWTRLLRSWRCSMGLNGAATCRRSMSLPPTPVAFFRDLYSSASRAVPKLPVRSSMLPCGDVRDLGASVWPSSSCGVGTSKPCSNREPRSCWAVASSSSDTGAPRSVSDATRPTSHAAVLSRSCRYATPSLAPVAVVVEPTAATSASTDTSRPARDDARVAGNHDGASTVYSASRLMCSKWRTKEPRSTAATSVAAVEFATAWSWTARRYLVDDCTSRRQ